MILLDTCAIIWCAIEPKTLTPAAIRAIQSARKKKSLYISDLSLWEIAMLIKKKRLEIKASYREFIDLVLSSEHYRILPVTPEIADTATGFPDHFTADPADHIITATAICHKLPLVTADKILRKFPAVKTIW